MTLFFHYCLPGFTNAYIVGADLPAEVQDAPLPTEALIIDPGVMDEGILEILENSNYTLRGVLITHDHPHHIQGLKTLKRIYDVEIFAENHNILDYRATVVKDGDVFTLGPFTVEVISVPGHSADSVIYRIENLLFTGDAITAGLVGSTASTYGASIQMTNLRSKIFSLPGDSLILPGHGPPSSLEAERQFNAGVHSYEFNKDKRRRSQWSFLND
jgi:glyoxylase-like metal-dependent hydrolase (beta-lactamase superfamily II)